MNDQHTRNQGPQGARRWQPLFAGGTADSRTDGYGLYSSVELQQLIEYERRQSERLGSPNALLICDLNGSARSKRAVKRVVSTIVRTVRHSDHVGWINATELAVLLPDTSPQSADVLKRKLEQTRVASQVELRVEAL